MNDESAMPSAPRVGLLLPSLAGGGVAPVVLEIANGLAAHGWRVDLVLCMNRGHYRERIDPAIRQVILEPEPFARARLRAWEHSPGARATILRPIMLGFAAPPALPYIASFARYLDQAKPDAVLSAKTHTNLVAIWAREMSSARPRLVVSEHTHLSREIETSPKWRWRYIAPVLGALYPKADAVVSVSDGVGDNIAAEAGLQRDSITTIYNPVDRPELHALASKPVDHPWLAGSDDVPVVLGVGRLVEQKSFRVLLDAFAWLRARREARLLILGEGDQRRDLEARARELGVESDVDLPGFVANPFAVMARASVFVLSSAWEGLGNVLIEALACGCPVVSSDCPSGPSEVLEGGRFGRLVPIGDAMALGAAIEATLDDPPEPALLRQRARAFASDVIVERYRRILEPR